MEVKLKSVATPSVKQYLAENNIPLKALLVMNNCPAQHSIKTEELTKEYFINIWFLPSISNFNVSTLGKNWEHFNILNCLRVIDKS